MSEIFWGAFFGATFGVVMTSGFWYYHMIKTYRGMVARVEKGISND